MYLSIKETAEYLSMPEAYIENLIQQKKLRAVYDGEQYLLNSEQFVHFHEQMETFRKQLAEWNNRPIPEDPDVKDED